MQSASLVLLQSDPRIVLSLVASLRSSFHSVQPVKSVDELWANIAKHQAEVAILDMEIASISDVERLAHEFPAVCLVCTHRLADEAMWAAAMNAGAADICLSNDLTGIVSAAARHPSPAHPVAA
jgi:DNA-binding NarL/FixJ family response regulator